MYFYILAVKTLFRNHEIRAQITRHPQILPKSRSDTNITNIRAVTRSHCMHAPSFTPEKILIASFARSRGCTRVPALIEKFNKAYVCVGATRMNSSRYCCWDMRP